MFIIVLTLDYDRIHPSHYLSNPPRFFPAETLGADFARLVGDESCRFYLSPYRRVLQTFDPVQRHVCRVTGDEVNLV